MSVVQQSQWPHVYGAGAYAIMVNDRDEVLLGFQGERHVWMLPGGGIEVGESAEQAAVRETKEETGFDVEIVRLAGMHDRFVDKGQSMFIFEATITGGEWTENDEIDRIQWFPLNELPSPISETSHARLEAFKKSRKETFYIKGL